MDEILACQEHIEEALDDAVYGGFEMPVLDQLLLVDNLKQKCGYCKKDAIYVVSNKHSTTR
ncbi:CxxH/CxxC protein [Carnobacterium sp. ISL-102]|uniref:CxxH/CxxC protein n=1 Tax=Carnobacterium sp. ISL-102 TaxID=2819142 RepID=UPI001BE7B631|nr:CxxH/CxxC protein [Carnobacterium sp. ISL-102]MBT2732951.1 CxxH/CxxC protein [Carnobacterium sp. ISL-102]